MLSLLFTNTTKTPYTEKLFLLLLRSAEKKLPAIPEQEVELVLLNDREIQKLNHEWRGLNKPTDVLSFANREVGEEMNAPSLPREESISIGDASAASGLARAEAAVIEGGPIVSSLGQIFISIPTARRNAKTMKQSLEEELQFLFVHGLLHLLGFDHQTPEQEKEMLKYAYKILGR
ncbi:MAG: rRNA maturation RNase YbeY [Candidatus Gracilibacteria bacterium]